MVGCPATRAVVIREYRLWASMLYDMPAHDSVSKHLDVRIDVTD